MAKDVDISLSADESIILFEWISQLNKRAETSFADQAEQRVLWDLEAKLESSLVEPLEANYDERLALARARVRDVSE